MKGTAWKAGFVGVRWPVLFGATVAVLCLAWWLLGSPENISRVSPMTTMAGARNRDCFGGSVLAMDDVTKDGTPEWVVGAGMPLGVGSGYVDLMHGGTLHLAWRQIEWTQTVGQSGLILASIADCDNDGCRDVIVGTGTDATVLSSRSGEMIGRVSTVEASSGPLQRVASVAGVAGILGDGSLGIVVGIPEGRDSRGVIRVLSWRAGDLVATGEGTLENGRIGMKLVAMSGDKFVAGGSGVVEVLDRRGDELRSRAVLRCGSAFGSDICAVGDIDGGGVPDYVVLETSDCEKMKRSGAIHVISGETDSEIGVVMLSVNHCVAKLARVADVDGDGSCEVLVLTETARADGRLAVVVSLGSQAVIGRLLFEAVPAEFVCFDSMPVESLSRAHEDAECGWWMLIGVPRPVPPWAKEAEAGSIMQFFVRCSDVM